MSRVVSLRFSRDEKGQAFADLVVAALRDNMTRQACLNPGCVQTIDLAGKSEERCPDCGHRVIVEGEES